MKIERFNEMLEEIQRERGIHKEALLEAIKASLLSAAKKRFKTTEEDTSLSVEITDAGEFQIIKEGENITPKDFGRLAAQTAKQVIIQRIREAEKEEAYGEFVEKTGELITGVIQRKEYGGYLMNLGRIETVLAVSEQIPGELLKERDRIKLYVVEIKKNPKGPYVVVSRAHPGMIKKLFELEVPEIKDGILEIKGIAREPGRRTKIAIHSKDPKIGAVGTCVGHMGARIQNIVKELGPERVDIIEWNSDPAKFIAAALSPAKGIQVRLNKGDQSAKVFIPEKELSLAIGKEGQNVRLAVKLTGWKIDILSDKEIDKEEAPLETASEKNKVRVHELAKKLGQSSKDIIAKLQESGDENAAKEKDSSEEDSSPEKDS